MQRDQDYLDMMNGVAVVDVSDLLVQYQKESAPDGTYNSNPKSKNKLARGIVAGLVVVSMSVGGYFGYQYASERNFFAVSEEQTEVDPLINLSDENQNTGVVNKELEPVVDKVKEQKATDHGTSIVLFSDRKLPPYEKPKCGIKDSSCTEEGISPADDLTGNNINDKVGAYRLDLGHRSVRTLDSSFVSPEIIISAMTDTVTRLGLKVEVPSKVDYESARVYSSGYSLWGIGEGYFLIYGNSQGIGVIGPDNKKETFSDALKNSTEVLITQSYAGKKAVTFAPLNKKVPGSVGVDVENESEWQ